MVFIGVFGTLSVGKSLFIDYCIRNYEFSLINLALENEKIKNNVDEGEKVSNLLIYDEIVIPETFFKDLFKNWKNNYIIYPINTIEILDKFCEKPFFKLIHIEAEISFAYKRFCEKHKTNIDLSSFIQINEKLFPLKKQGYFRSKSDCILYNDKEEVFPLENDLLKKTLCQKRPTWDEYFMEIAFSARSRSNCMKFKNGSILVLNNRILSTGYTGTGQGMLNCNDGGCKACNIAEPSNIACLCIHSEENCVLELGSMASQGSTCYTTHFPCIWCAKILCHAQIKRLVYSEVYDLSALQVFKRTKIEISQLKFNAKDKK